MTFQTCRCPDGSKEIKDVEKRINQLNTTTDSYPKQTEPDQHRAGEAGTKSLLGEQQSPAGKALDQDDPRQLAQTPVM